MAIRKEIRDTKRAVDALAAVVKREDFSEEEFEVIKGLSVKIENTILVYRIHDSLPPSETTH